LVGKKKPNWLENNSQGLVKGDFETFATLPRENGTRKLVEEFKFYNQFN
jgi:hypothetical protein